MERLVLRIVVNAVSLAAAVRFIEGIEYHGKWWMMLAIAVIFGLINVVIKPIIQIFSFPLIILTLGLFTLVINALMLALTAELSEAFGLGLVVKGFWPAVKGAFVISVVSFLLSWLSGLKGRKA
jgi:putative membrane protein